LTGQILDAILAATFDGYDMDMDIPKVHWFQDTKKQNLFAVVAPGDVLLSPDLVAARFDGEPLSQIEVIEFVRSKVVKPMVSVFVDFAVQAKFNIQQILDDIPSSITESVASFRFEGVFALADSALHQQLLDEGDFMRRRAQSMMDSVEELSPLDATGRSLLALKTKKDYSDQDFFKAIEHDAALCAQLLTWGTSAYYGPSSSSDTMENVVVKNLGIDKALVLSIGLSIQKAFQIEKDLRPCLVDNVTRSIYVSNVVRSVSARVFLPHESRLISLCGLLHNMGDLVVMQVAPAMYRRYNTYRLFNPAHTLEFVQNSTLGFVCSQMGVILAKRWNLPPQVIDVIANAHLGADASLRTGVEARLVTLTKRILADQGFINHQYDGDLEQGNMGLPASAIESIVSDFHAKQAYYNIIAQAMSV
jgi:HD-like signal output (HDOD) protein